MHSTRSSKISVQHGLGKHEQKLPPFPRRSGERNLVGKLHRNVQLTWYLVLENSMCTACAQHVASSYLVLMFN